MELLRLMRRMGYRILGVPRDLASSLEEEASRLGLRLVPRVHVVAESRRDLAQLPGGGVIVVEPRTLDAARRAAVMRSVSLIRVSPGMQRIVDKSTSRLFRARGGGAIEVSLKHITTGSPSAWRWFSVTLRRAYAYGINVVLVSDASSPWEAWHPRVVEGLATIPGIPGPLALSWISNVPRSIVGEVAGTG